MPVDKGHGINRILHRGIENDPLNINNGSLGTKRPADYAAEPTVVLNVDDIYAQSEIRATTVMATSSGTLLPENPLDNRKMLRIYHDANETLYIGGSGVGISDGFPVPPGEEINIPVGRADIYGVFAVGSHEVRVLELA